MKRLYIETYGCQMNTADSEVIASIMKMADYTTTDNIDEADAILLNTFSIRDNAEQKIFNRLETLHNQHKNASKAAAHRCFNQELQERSRRDQEQREEDSCRYRGCRLRFT